MTSVMSTRTDLLLDGGAAGHVAAGHLRGGLGHPAGHVQQSGASGHFFSDEGSAGMTVTETSSAGFVALRVEASKK